jgi:hypothetical protein
MPFPLSWSKLLTLTFVILASANLAFSAPLGRIGGTGKVAKVDPQSITLHWAASKNRLARIASTGWAEKGQTWEYTYKLTPETTYWQGGNPVALSDIHKGDTVKITAARGIVSRIDIVRL